MGHPVVHFEVIGRDPDELRRRIARIRARADELGGDFDSAESIRAERDWLDHRDRTR